MEGWDDDLGQLRDVSDLPAAARRYLHRIEELVGCPVEMVSVGAERAQTIALRDPFVGGR
jgi:adenylosuccinate synthase